MAEGGRVIAGSARGIRLESPPEGTRPLTDRVKESLFAALEATDALDGPFLDLFAGSGAAGIEALSRGAPSATFVEHDGRDVPCHRRQPAPGATRRRARGACRRPQPPAERLAREPRAVRGVRRRPAVRRAAPRTRARAARRRVSGAGWHPARRSWRSISGATNPPSGSAAWRGSDRSASARRCSPSTRQRWRKHEDGALSRLVRSDHVRSRRRHQARRDRLRPARGGRADQPPQDAAAVARGAHGGDPRGRRRRAARSWRADRGRQLRRADRRLTRCRSRPASSSAGCAR